MTRSLCHARVAVVGSGISGLAAAWRLAEAADVTLFEQRDALGLGSEGHVIETPNGAVRVDVPPRVFNAGHYRALTALLSDARMPTYEIAQRPRFTDVHGRAYLAFDTVGSGAQTEHRLNWSGTQASWLLRHGRQLLRWQRQLARLDVAQMDADETVRDALTRLGVSAEFRDGVLYPMWTLMCTCRYADLDAFPAAALFSLAQNFAGAFATRRLQGGTQALEHRLVQRVASVRLGCAVRGIEQRGDHVLLHAAQASEPERFSHVVVATDPVSSCRLLGDGHWSAERRLLEQVPLHQTQMTLKTASPEQVAALRSPVTLHYDAARRRAAATIWMNPIEPEPLGASVVQSWSVEAPAQADNLLTQRTFYRALLSVDSQRAMARLRSRMRDDAQRRVWCVGSHVGQGVPLLETGVQSAEMVAALVQQSLARDGRETSAKIA